MQRFNSKTVLITGGTNGIGYATAEEFIIRGAKVIITGRKHDTVNNAIKKLGRNAHGIISDAGNIQDIMQLATEVKKYADSIDVLFVNAGYGKFAAIEDTDEELFDELFNMLVKGTYFTVQQILPLINKQSSIILNTSFVTKFGMPNFSIYTAAKSAVGSFIKSFAAECTDKQIRVNGISPGYIQTNIFNNTGLNAEEIDSTIKNVIPTLPYKRFGLPKEIASTVLFLASKESSYIHGAEIAVDGGLSITK
ncbi:SDR family oxidoreductase [Flavobacterium sp. MK4S-17]|uniref:SDR family oxidoreductase n=1 Tax=Flavobacterium sp. MK4S-17 TaxID=2543737 RepID=UPI00135BE4F6|nr:SDR family oxidoreductase [Flavobacterium sp. MK4S-17]